MPPEKAKAIAADKSRMLDVVSTSEKAQAIVADKSRMLDVVSTTEKAQATAAGKSRVDETGAMHDHSRYTTYECFQEA